MKTSRRHIQAVAATLVNQGVPIEQAGARAVAMVEACGYDMTPLEKGRPRRGRPLTLVWSA